MGAGAGFGGRGFGGTIGEGLDCDSFVVDDFSGVGEEGVERIALIEPGINDCASFGGEDVVLDASLEHCEGGGGVEEGGGGGGGFETAFDQGSEEPTVCHCGSEREGHFGAEVVEHKIRRAIEGERHGLGLDGENGGGEDSDRGFGRGHGGVAARGCDGELNAGVAFFGDADEGDGWSDAGNDSVGDRGAFVEDVAKSDASGPEERCDLGGA